MKKLITILAVIFLSLTLSAQDFKVLLISGDCKIQSNGKYQKALVGQKVVIENLQVNSGYIALLYRGTKTIEISKSGTYSNQQLIQLVNSQNKSTSEKYFGYLTSEIKKSESEDMSKNRYKYMSVVGSVERGNADGIYLNIPSTSYISREYILLKWNRVKCDSCNYIIEINNMFGDKIIDVTTRDTSINLKLSDKFEKNYVINIRCGDKKCYGPENKSDSYNIKYLSESDLNTIRNEANNLNDNTSIGYLLLANYYETNGLIIDAIWAYEQCIKLNPEISFFKNSYYSLLERSSLLKKN